MATKSSQSDRSIPAVIFGLALLVTAVSAPFAWLTHVVVTIRAEEWLFLIAGAIAAPIGVIHGWGLWFGWW